MVIIGSLTGNMLPPFAIKLMFGGLTEPFGLECAAANPSDIHGAVRVDRLLLDENTLWSSKIQRAEKSQVGLAYLVLVN
jgi:hypothetical protein